MAEEANKLRFETLGIDGIKGWLLVAMFVVGNLFVPQLCHLVPKGGLILLPIYFFTLVAAYKYGWKVGMLTAILSPVLNWAIFGMPALDVLPIILVKGLLLVCAASYAASRTRTVSLLIMAAVVLSYQIVGCTIESIVAGDIAVGFQDMVIGMPGMLLQIFGGWLVIKHLL